MKHKHSKVEASRRYMAVEVEHFLMAALVLTSGASQKGLCEVAFLLLSRKTSGVPVTRAIMNSFKNTQNIAVFKNLYTK